MKFLNAIMKRKLNIFKGIRQAIWVSGIALLANGAVSMAETTKVDERTVVVTADPVKKEVSVEFRLVDGLAVTGATAVSMPAVGKGESLTATWEAWGGEKAKPCAWMIVVDTSNPARVKTVQSGVEFVRSFLAVVPVTDTVQIETLALNLEEVSGLGVSVEERLKNLAKIKVGGDASKTTLIYTNLTNGLGKLDGGKGMRKALILLSDGKDETPGSGGEAAKKKLIEDARKAGVVVHTVGYAEVVADQKYFAGLKEISGQTEGIFVAADVASKAVPAEFAARVLGVMHGAGVARIDLAKLGGVAAELSLTVTTADKKTATVKVPKEKVAEALGASPAELAKVKAEEDAKAKKAEEEAKKAASGGGKSAAGEKAALPPWVWWAVGGVGVVIVLVVVMMVRSSNQRAAELSRMNEEAVRAAEAAENRRDEERKKVELTKKAEVAPLGWLEMCDAQQTRHAVRMSSLKIGRGQHNDVVFKNDSVSGNHCVLNCNREGGWTITDTNSGNGVVLNGEKVLQGGLKHGDTIELGELKMRFLLR